MSKLTPDQIIDAIAKGESLVETLTADKKRIDAELAEAKKTLAEAKKEKEKLTEDDYLAVAVKAKADAAAEIAELKRQLAEATAKKSNGSTNAKTIVAKEHEGFRQKLAAHVVSKGKDRKAGKESEFVLTYKEQAQLAADADCSIDVAKSALKFYAERQGEGKSTTFWPLASLWNESAADVAGK